MTNPTWPVTLPQKPAAGGFTGGPQDNRVSFQPEIGPSIDRRRGTAVSHVYDVRLPVMSLVELNYFKTFFETDLMDGVLPFDWTDPLYGDSATWRFTGGSPPYSISEKGYDSYEVSYSLMRTPS